jgi:hypothetical protein
MLEIPIPLDPDKISPFLEHLRLAVKDWGNWRGEGQYDEQGRFAERVFWSPVSGNTDNPEIELEIKWESDGRISGLRVRPRTNAPVDWQTRVENAVRNALLGTLNAQTTKFFFRHTFAYVGPPLSGEYYISGLRFAPAHPRGGNDLPIEEQVVHLDLHAAGVDREQAFAIASTRSEEGASVLSTLLDIGLYKLNPERRWVLTKDGPVRLPLGYISSSPQSMPEKGVEYSAGEYQPVDRTRLDYWRQATGHYLSVPNDLRGLWRKLESLLPQDREAFISAAHLFRLSLVAGRHFPSVKMAYAIAAVDALPRGHERSASTFGDFVTALCPEISAKEAKAYYARVRSGHFHTGTFPGGDFEPLRIGPFSGPGMLLRFNEQFAVHAVMHAALIRWLGSR